MAEVDRQASELARLRDVCRIGADRADEAAETLLDAFAGDPFMEWMLEGSARTRRARHQKHRRYWQWCCRNLMADWEMHALGDLSAVAIWYPLPEVSAVELEDPFERFCRDLLGASRRFGELLEVLKQCKQVMGSTLGQRPAWYLAAVGVGAELKGQGRGGQLLEVMLRRCDRLGLPAYLESSTRRNVPFYRRLGFEQMEGGAGGSGDEGSGGGGAGGSGDAGSGELLIEVPGGEPLIPMLRQPRKPPRNQK